MSVDKYKFISPGVFVSEIDNTGRTTAPQDVGPVIIGRSEKGPILRPIRVESYIDFVNEFGAPIPGGRGGDVVREGNYTSPTYGAYAAQAWFRNNSPVTYVRLGGRAHEQAVDVGSSLAGWATTFTAPSAFTQSIAADTGGAYGLFVSNVPTRSGFLSGTITVAEDTVPAGQTIVFDDGFGTVRTITSGTTTNETTFDGAGPKNTIATAIKTAINAGGGIFTATVGSGDPSDPNVVVLEVDTSVSPLDDVPTLYQGPSLKESGGAAIAATAEIAGVTPGTLVAGQSFTLTNAAGTTTTYTINGGGAFGTQPGGAAGATFDLFIGGAGSIADICEAITKAIAATTDADYSASDDGITVTVTQGTAGHAGNRTNGDTGTGLGVDSDPFVGGLDGPSALAITLEGTEVALANDTFGQCEASYGAVTGTLAAVWYLDQKAIISLSGTRCSDGTNTVTGSSTYFDSVGAKQFKVQIKSDQGIEVDSSFDFSETSDKFIRKIFNTNPILTNNAATDSDSNSFTRYWLGESYGGAVDEALGTDTSHIGVILPLVCDASKGGNVKRNFQDAESGFFFAQDLAIGSSATGSFDVTKTQNLFKLVARNSGGWVARNLKISIKDIKAPSNDTIDPYGSFSVVLRKITDTDNRMEIVEQFNNCNLNPSSQNFIGRKIGTMKVEWDEEERKYRSLGDWINKSKYVFVELPEEVLKGDTDPRFLPFGVRGPLRYNSFIDTKDQGQLSDTIVSGTLGTPGHTVPDGTFISGSTDGQIKFDFPALRMRTSGSEGNPVDPLNAFYGVDTTFNSSRYNKSTADHLKVKPVGTGDFIADSNTAISYNFTLDDMCRSGSSGKTFAYKAGARVADTTTASKTIGARDGLEYLRGTGSFTEVLNAGVDRYTTVFNGGFDGLDITESEPLRIVNDGTLSPFDVKTNYMFNSVQSAIDSVRDPDVIEYDIAVMPGIMNSTLNTTLIDMCESRGDSLAIVDIKGGYTSQYESLDDESDRRGSVDATVSELKQEMVINSSYGATYYPWVQIKDPNNGQVLWVPPSVVALGAMSYGQKTSALWFAPAGFTRGGLSQGRAGIPVVGVRDRLTSRERDTLYENRINPIAQFPAEGIVIFGQKTLQMAPSALDRVNIRRLMILLKRQISRMAATILFDQNVQVTWNRFKSQVDPFLRGVQSGLGITEYKLVLDETTTTPDLVDRNVMYAKIFIKPARAIEYIAIDFILTDSGAAFED